MITAPNGVHEWLATETNLVPGGLSALVAGDVRLGSADRVNIYADMYFYRLLRAIKENFPATVATLGNIKFHNLITEYLVEYPPGHHSITEASRHLARFAEDTPLAAEFPFLADLIRLERATIEAFLGPDAEPLSCEELRVTPATEWPSLRFGLHPTVQLLDCCWRVSEFQRAVDEGKPVTTPVEESNTIIVWRNETVRCRPLEKAECNALAAVCSGEPFTRACGSIENDNREMTPAELSEMLFRWVAKGVVVKIDGDG
jgi:hypothetical protein